MAQYEKLVNCLSHKVTILKEVETGIFKEIISFPPSGKEIRCVPKEQSEFYDLTEMWGFPVYDAPVFENISNLPESNETDIIVSEIVARYMAKHTDWKGRVFFPDTGPGSVIKSPNGQLIGVRRMLICNKATA